MAEGACVAVGCAGCVVAEPPLASQRDRAGAMPNKHKTSCALAQQAQRAQPGATANAPPLPRLRHL